MPTRLIWRIGWYWEAGIPFREAHHIVGRIVALAEKLGVKLEELPLNEMQKVESRIQESVYEALRYDAKRAGGV